MPVGTLIPRVTIPTQCATWECGPKEKCVATIVAVTWVMSFKVMKAAPERGSESIPSVCNTLKVHQPPSSQRDHSKHLRKQIKTCWECEGIENDVFYDNRWTARDSPKFNVGDNIAMLPQYTQQ